MTFPADLPDLLRVACKAQGRLRLHAIFSAELKWQAALANSGQGWTTDHNEDCLEAMTSVLRQRYGAMLERQRAAEPPVEDDDGSDAAQWEIEDGVMFALTRRGFSDDDAATITEEVLDRIWGALSQPHLTRVTMTTAAPAEVDEFEALL